MVRNWSVTFIKRAVNQTKCSLKINIVNAVYGELLKQSFGELADHSNNLPAGHFSLFIFL